MELTPKIVVFCFIVKVVLLIHFTVAHEEVQFDVDLNVDTSNYVDPHDMLNYKPQSILSSSTTKRTIQATNENVVSAVSKNVESDGIISVDVKPVKNDDLTAAAEPTATPTPPVSKLKQSNLVKKEKQTDFSTCPATDPIASKERPFLGRFLKTLSSTLQLEVTIFF